MPEFTATQGRYLSFIYAYINLYGYPPAELEIATALSVSPPSVNQMVKTLENRGLIQRIPGQARSIQILVPDDEIPTWKSEKKTTHLTPPTPQPPQASITHSELPANVYVLTVQIGKAKLGPKISKKRVPRTIEIRGDQTLEDLHEIIFMAYDRWDEHLYEFQFGKRPFYDREGPNYGVNNAWEPGAGGGDSTTTKLDTLKLKPGRVFGYWFDFGDDWFHLILVDRIDQAIPNVTYPRITMRLGESPPQYFDEDE